MAVVRLLGKAVVVAVDEAEGPAAGDEDCVTVTLQVTRKEAQLLAEQQKTGEFRLLLRAAEDSNKKPVSRK